MPKLSLALLACPVVGAVLLPLAAPAHATEGTTPAAPALSNPAPPRPDLSDRLEFTDAESDAAIARFGCDCPSCINALRQLRNQSPLPR